MSRKPVDVNPTQISKLASFGCTVAEISAFFNISPSTVNHKFASFIAKGKEIGKMRLRQLQWKSAKAGNVQMQIWLGKNLLGQTDRNIFEPPKGKLLIFEDRD
jgi:hypothetical protein